MKKEKPITVYSAIAANLFIAVVKFVVSFITGSSAMLAEAIHSTADTGNELLLLFGVHRSRKPADEQHPFGYGQELYFWGLVVAILLFSAGAGMAIYEGITNLSHPHEIRNPGWTYVVLGFAFLADGTSWVIAFRTLLKRKKPGESFWQTLKASKDPSVFMVFGEDSADIAGLVVAFLGIFLGQLLHNPYPDVIASILVGLILVIVAFFLAYESKSLLIGETADTEMVTSVQKLVQGHPDVAKAQRPLSVQLGPDEVFLALGVEFKPGLSAAQLVGTIDELEKRIHEKHKNVGQVFMEAKPLNGADSRRSAHS